MANLPGRSSFSQNALGILNKSCLYLGRLLVHLKSGYQLIAGVGAPFNGTRTVNSGVTDYTFSCDITNADITLKNIIPAGTATLTGASTYVGNSAVEQAVLAVAVEIFSSRVAPGGQMEGIDFTNVSPYRLGRSLFNRVSGLLGAYLDVETMAQ